MKGSSCESCGVRGGHAGADVRAASMKGSSWESCGRHAGLHETSVARRGLNEGQLLGELRVADSHPVVVAGDHASMKGSSWESCGDKAAEIL